MTVRLGETYLHGRGQIRARTVLEAADRAGVPRRLVRAVDDGYIVPNAVADALEEQETVPEWSAREATF